MTGVDWNNRAGDWMAKGKLNLLLKELSVRENNC